MFLVGREKARMIKELSLSTEFIKKVEEIELASEC